MWNSNPRFQGVPHGRVQNRLNNIIVRIMDGIKTSPPGLFTAHYKFSLGSKPTH